MKSLPSIWFALIVLALLAALTYWIDRTVQPPAPKRDGSTRHDPDYTVNNFFSSRADQSGNPRYGLSGVEMRHYPDDDTTELVHPLFKEFSLSKPTIQAQGDRGTVSSNGENVYFMDNVRVVRAATPQKGELTIVTEYLHITPEQGILKTDRPVTILQAPRTVANATGMELDKNERTLKLFNHVTVHYERPGAPLTPPLKIEQITGSRAKLAVPLATKNVRNEKTLAKPHTAKPHANTGKSAKKPEPRSGQSSTRLNKTRIRRHYGNPAH
jgi:lipopolysaccharide export system protein LptC